MIPHQSYEVAAVPLQMRPETQRSLGVTGSFIIAFLCRAPCHVQAAATLIKTRAPDTFTALRADSPAGETASNPQAAGGATEPQPLLAQGLHNWAWTALAPAQVFPPALVLAADL